MDRHKKELLSSLLIVGFALTILVSSMLALHDYNTRQAALTGSFIFDNGCYGIYNAGRLSCIASNIGKQCLAGCYVARLPTGNSCECLQE